MALKPEQARPQNKLTLTQQRRVDALEILIDRERVPNLYKVQEYDPVVIKEVQNIYEQAGWEVDVVVRHEKYQGDPDWGATFWFRKRR
jgi:hypothetical protein